MENMRSMTDRLLQVQFYKVIGQVGNCIPIRPVWFSKPVNNLGLGKVISTRKHEKCLSYHPDNDDKGIEKNYHLHCRNTTDVICKL